MIATVGVIENPQANTILADIGKFRADIENCVTNIMISSSLRCTVVFEHLAKDRETVIYEETYIVDGSFFGTVTRDAKRNETIRLRLVESTKGVVQGTFTSMSY